MAKKNDLSKLKTKTWVYVVIVGNKDFLAPGVGALSGIFATKALAKQWVEDMDTDMVEILEQEVVMPTEFYHYD